MKGKISRTKLPPEQIFLKSVKATECCGNKETHTHKHKTHPITQGFNDKLESQLLIRKVAF